MNDENLIPFNKRTEREQREIAKKGGEASVKARQEKRAFRELLEIAFSSTVKDESTGEEASRKEMTAARLVERCTNGDIKAIALAAELLGEKVVQTAVAATVMAPQRVDLNKLTDEQRSALLSIGLELINKKE